MELDPQHHNRDGLLGPNSIMVVYMDHYAQTFQSPLIKEYTLSHIRDPIIIQGIFHN